LHRETLYIRDPAMQHRRTEIAPEAPIVDGTAAGSPPALRRISVIGSTGSGKTYMSRRLSARLGLPLVELDQLRLMAEGTHHASGDDFAVAVRAVVSKECWVIDGHYREVRHMVWNDADLVIFLDYPLLVIVRQLFGRYFAKRFQRPGGSEKPRDPASWARRLRRFAKTLAERREYHRVLSMIDNTNVRVKRFRNRAAAAAWIEAL
jgi:adenylate kinase family enzyme